MIQRRIFNMLWLTIIIFIAVLDQISKIIIINNIESNSSVTTIDNFFYLTHVKNTGAALGILQNGRYFLIPVTIIISVLLLYVLIKSDNKLLKTSLALTVGGAAGNLIDRVIRGSVTDFIDLYFGSFHFWTFNIADVSVFVGTILLVYYILFVHKDAKKDAKVKDKNE